MNPMNEDVQQLLLNLKLKAIAAHLDEYLAAAERDATPFATLFAQLLRAEWQARQQAALAARLKRAQLPETWTLETFPFKIQTGVKERKLLRTLANVDVLAIDELGYLNIKPEQTNIFFKLMEERHHRKPTLLTTNLPYPAWQDFLGNKALTQALLSRLRERCHTVVIDGPCLRAQQG